MVVYKKNCYTKFQQYAHPDNLNFHGGNHVTKRNQNEFLKQSRAEKYVEVPKNLTVYAFSAFNKRFNVLKP